MKLLASSVKAKYGTSDPFDIARKCSITIIVEPLGNVQGYYNNAFGKKFIHLNEDLPEYYQRYVVAHLLYRAFTSPEEMLFLKSKTATRFTESEAEANRFAVNLMISDEDLTYLSADEIMSKYGLSNADKEELYERLYNLWDENRKMTREELFRHVILRTTELRGTK